MRSKRQGKLRVIMHHAETTAAAGPDQGGGPETPSGKSSDDENFPVGSFLIAAPLRPHVATFYAFARAADDIADNPDLTAFEKVERLNGLETVLTGGEAPGPGFEKALALKDSLAQCGVTDQHARDLLEAFRQDAVKLRYASWQELMGYCALSANPVGRYLLDLHGESPDAYPQSDALCTVLQVLNHLQDCADDQRELHRVYIPDDWMALEGVSMTDLDNGALEPGMRRVLDRMLMEVDVLLAEADNLAGVLKSRRLAMESAVIVRLAHRLSAKLKARDPLAERVALSKVDFAVSGVRGMVEGLFGPRKAA